MNRIGQEITFGEMQPARLPNERAQRSAHVLDLRAQRQAGRDSGRQRGNYIDAARPPEDNAAIEEAGPSHPVGKMEINAVSRKFFVLPKRKFRLPAWRQLLVHVLKAAIVVAAAIGFLLLNIPLAERLIGIYFAVAVVYAVDSQRTFLVALIFLIMVAVWSALENSVSAEDYATYAFYFLVIGLITAIREMLTGKNHPAAES